MLFAHLLSFDDVTFSWGGCVPPSNSARTKMNQNPNRFREGKERHLPVSWTSCQLPGPERSGRLNSAPAQRWAHERIQFLVAEQLVWAGNPPHSAGFPNCRRLVCTQFLSNIEVVPGAARGAPEIINHGRSPGATFIERKRQALAGRCEPVLAHALSSGNHQCDRADRERPWSIGNCLESHGPLVASADEQRGDRAMASCCQMAASSSE